MRKITMLLLFVLTAVITKAQDIIVKNDKTEIKVKVLEITDVAIKYKKETMLDGPTYTINKSEVFMIIYQNGTKEYMEVVQPKPIAPKQPTPTQNNASTVTSVTNAMNTTNGNSYQSSSTSKASNKTHWGIQLGVLNTSATVGAGVIREAAIRMRLGAYCAIPISTNLSFVPAATITGKGTHLYYYEPGASVSEDINISFIEIPFGLQYVSGGHKGLLLGIAPTLGIIISQSEKGTTTYYPSSYTSSFSSSPGFTTTELSTTFTAGYKFSKKFSLALAYNTAFTDISPNTISYKTNYLGLNISFGF